MGNMLPGVKYRCYMCKGTGDYQPQTQSEVIDYNSHYLQRTLQCILNRMLYDLDHLSEEDKDHIKFFLKRS
jgi:hypothetical protein